MIFTSNIPTDASYANGILTINVGESASLDTRTEYVLRAMSHDFSGNAFNIAYIPYGGK